MFTKEFKLAAVRRLEQGVSIGEAARAFASALGESQRIIEMDFKAYQEVADGWSCLPTSTDEHN